MYICIYDMIFAVRKCDMVAQFLFVLVLLFVFIR